MIAVEETRGVLSVGNVGERNPEIQRPSLFRFSRGAREVVLRP